MFPLQEGGITPTADSLSYMADADRFITDTAAVAKIERDNDFHKQESKFYNRRVERAHNEEERWRTIEMKHQVEQKRLEEMRDNYSYARSNKTSMPYNPINLRYDDGCAPRRRTALHARASARSRGA